MSDSDRERLDALFDEFERRFNAGEGPDTLDYFERAGDVADMLAARITRFLATSAPPEPTQESVAEMLREPALAAAAAASYGDLLRRWREARHLSRARFARRLAQDLEVESQEAKVKRYYADLENDLLPPTGLDARVVDAITKLLGVPRKQLRALAKAWSPPAAADAGTVLARAGQASPAKRARPPASGPDEVDHLFVGGV